MDKCKLQVTPFTDWRRSFFLSVFSLLPCPVQNAVFLPLKWHFLPCKVALYILQSGTLYLLLSHTEIGVYENIVLSNKKQCTFFEK